MNLWNWQLRKSLFSLALLCAAVVWGGCEDTPQDKMREARGALVAGNVDVAQARLDEVLKEEPDLLEARRLMADVHMRRGDFEQAETSLEALWNEQGYDAGENLDPTQRRYRGLINEQFNTLYRRWVEEIDPGEQAETFEAVARKGLERDSRNARLNALLADFYQERAERFVERGDKIRAAEELEKIDALRIFADVRRETRERARNLRREAFSDEARRRFAEDIQPDLMESDAYDQENERLQITIERRVDRSLDPSEDEDRNRTQRLAMQTLAPSLAQMAITLTGLELEEIQTSRLSTPEIKVENEDFQRGRYEMTAVISLEAMIDMAFDYAEFERTRSPEIQEEEPQEAQADPPSDSEDEHTADE